ncbi:hypothetical protein E4P82_11020 [Candidatus Competibacter phosphatis]|uniref:Uncharacterized protein n=1 Tax=Candidatus Competibacter phosphatis TaxID=221280 RepID=A0ABX1TNH3_9GAMM|nr:hypothetical protein [Candidatus Competibacter phosphatis]NMQ19683.1 hypothetical protein [Candidatus Competibacter phosphatis]
MLPVPTDARLFGGHELLSGLSRASFKSSSSLADSARSAAPSDDQARRPYPIRQRVPVMCPDRQPAVR